jgi:hypothetical protein
VFKEVVTGDKTSSATFILFYMKLPTFSPTLSPENNSTAFNVAYKGIRLAISNLRLWSAIVLADFAKGHDKLEIRIGIINGSVADLATIKEYASIPSREGLLTMLASGMIEHVRNLSIALNLYAEEKEN